MVDSLHMAHGALMESLYSILDSDADDKAGMVRESAGQYADHIAELCKAKMARGETAALAAEAFILRAESEKPEGDYGAPSEAGYADPGYQSDKKPRYPLKEGGSLSEKRIRAAWSYINQQDNAAKYSSGDLAKVRNRIKAAAKEVGIEISEEAQERAADTQVSRSEDRGEPEATVTRAEILQAELVRAQAALEETRTRLAAAETSVKRLEAMPLAVPPVKYRTYHGLEREFLQNLGNEGAAEVERLKAEYDAVMASIPAETDPAKKYQAIDRSIDLKRALFERGVRL
jgi:hypothetical protein